MGAPPTPKEEPENEDWLVTYADAITLLMAFFVLLMSFSKVDLEIFDSVANGLSETLGTDRLKSKQDKQQRKDNLQDVITNAGADDAMKLGADSAGSITLELSGGAFFKPGSAELRDQAIPVLEDIHREISSVIFDQFNIFVEGHTDDDPINSPIFASNWELSTGRASRVVRFFIAREMRANRFSAIGYAETQPKVPNRDLAGNAIRENQEANRRIVIRLNRRPIYTPVKIPKFRRKEPPAADNADKKPTPEN